MAKCALEALCYHRSSFRDYLHLRSLAISENVFHYECGDGDGDDGGEVDGDAILTEMRTSKISAKVVSTNLVELCIDLVRK